MKTDKELLELAAKAVGIVGEWVDDYNPTHDYFYQGNHSGFYVGEAVGGSCTVWNPLTDDGDAFRLAVKLNISIDISETWLNMFYNNKVLIATPIIVAEKGEATRRAIVRAAAAIGKSK